VAVVAVAVAAAKDHKVLPELAETVVLAAAVLALTAVIRPHQAVQPVAVLAVTSVQCKALRAEQV
jgi:hypothetical protein